MGQQDCNVNRMYLLIVISVLSFRQLSIQHAILFLLKQGKYVVVEWEALDLILILILLICWLLKNITGSDILEARSGGPSRSGSDAGINVALQCTCSLVNVMVCEMMDLSAIAAVLLMTTCRLKHCSKSSSA